MASKELAYAVSEYKRYIDERGLDLQAIDALVQAQEVAIVTEKDVAFGLNIGRGIKKYVEQYCEQKSGGNFAMVEKYGIENKVTYSIVDMMYKSLLIEAPHCLDSFCLYIERYRPNKERFYEPRRKTLKIVTDHIQSLEDDKLDELYLHTPPRCGKSGVITMSTVWHCCRHSNLSNLYITYKEGLGGAFIDGVMEILTDPTYATYDVFPNTRVAYTDAKNHKIDLDHKKKYKTLSGKGLESGLNGEYDASGWLIVDDPLEGIQDVLNPETLRRKQIVFDNNVMSRKKEKCKQINIGTLWGLHDIYSDRLDFLQNNPEASNIRWEMVKIPALDENDKSNFDYDYGVGFSTRYYKTLRAKFEDNDDLASWMAQYQQEPIERDGAVFNPENMKFYNGVLPNEEPVRICGACDVALGGTDFLSMPIAYIYENGDVYIHEVVYDNSEKDKTQPQVVNAIIENNVGSVFFEANAGGELYKDDIDRLLREKGYKINLQSKYAPTNKRKEQRIWDKAPQIRDWYFRDVGCRDLPYRKFMQNVYTFTATGKNKHEDAPDSLATLADFISGNGMGARVEAVWNPFMLR